MTLVLLFHLICCCHFFLNFIVAVDVVVDGVIIVVHCCLSVATGGDVTVVSTYLFDVNPNGSCCQFTCTGRVMTTL